MTKRQRLINELSRDVAVGFRRGGNLNPTNEQILHRIEELLDGRKNLGCLFDSLGYETDYGRRNRFWRDALKATTDRL